MIIKHKIKTWHIVVLVILGIGGYWLSQNMWVFEKQTQTKQISINKYETYLSNTSWRQTKIDRILEFRNRGKLYEYFLGTKKEDYHVNGTWKINDDILILTGKEFMNNQEKDLYVEMKIISFFEDTIIAVLHRPRVNRKVEYEFKKVSIE